MQVETETNLVKVQVEANGVRYEASGTPEEIANQILQFVSQTVPTFDLARKLLYIPDLAGLSDTIADYAKMTSTGQLLLTRNDLPTGRAILVILFMAHLACKTAKRDSGSLSIEEIANGARRASKTIRNVIVELQKSGFIEREDRGRYKVTPKGLMQLETSLLDNSTRGGASE